MVASKLVLQADIAEALVDCCLYEIPLGRALLQTDAVAADVLVKALRLQTLIRDEQMAFVDAIEDLVKA